MQILLQQYDDTLTMQIAARELLRTWIREPLDPHQLSWVDVQLNVAQQFNSADPRAFDLAFGLVPRKLGKARLQLDEKAISQAMDTLPGWHPAGWSVDVALRVLLMTQVPQLLVGPLIRRLLRHADLSEQLALYRGLPLYPCSTDLVEQVQEGLRSNIQDVFNAIAQENPWPALHLDEHHWNHLVLKALFVDSALGSIVGLDERSNPALSHMLFDYAHERRSAERLIRFDLWRALGSHTTLAAMRPFLPVLCGDSHWIDNQKTAVLTLALLASADTTAVDYARRHSPCVDAIEAGAISWSNLIPSGNHPV